MINHQLIKHIIEEIQVFALANKIYLVSASCKWADIKIAIIKDDRIYYYSICLSYFYFQDH